MTKEKYVLGVTGSMSCGKSYVCEKLTDLCTEKGITVTNINLDTLRRDILGQNPKYSYVRREIESKFGEAIVCKNGSIDGKIIGEQIFYDQNAMTDYRNIMQDPINKRLQEEISDSNGLVLVEWALLAEDKLTSAVNYNVLLVSCSAEEQMRRLEGGDLGEDQIQKRIDAQMSNSEKKKEIETVQTEQGRGVLYEIDTTQGTTDAKIMKLLINIARELE